MSRSIFWKITVPFALLILVSMGVLGFYMVNSVRNSQLDHLRTTLKSEASLVADTTLPNFINAANPGSFDTIAKTLGKQIDSRITIIAKNGTVLGDTWEDPSTMENHANRPEVMAALASGVGESTRYSTTTNLDMMYVAVPIVSQGTVLGIARVGLPLTAVENSTASTLHTISWAIVIAAILVIIAAAVITRTILRQVRQVTRAAEKISSGQFDQQIQISSNDELGKLAQSFNKMSTNLKDMMAIISDDKSKLETVLSTMADGVIMTDSKGNIMLINQACEFLFGIQGDRITGKPLIEAIINYEIDNVLKKCIETNKKQIAQIDTINGRFLRVIASPLQSNKIPGVLLLLQDLTEMRNLQTMRREFIGNVSHELRTPLAAIKAITDTLQDGAIDDKEFARDFLNKVNSEIDSLTQMVNELIEISRIETGKTKLNLETTDLHSLIEDVIAHLTPQAERKPVAIITKFEDDLPSIQVDREKIRQVLINILHNAIKFTPAQGTISVSGKVSGDNANVSVADTGIGISKADLPHIFERFFKADKSRSSGGSGLGLAIAKHIIQAHGGEIWAESQEGKGSTFSFSIPLSPPSSTLKAPPTG